MGREEPGSLMTRTVKMLDGRDLVVVASEAKLNYHWLVKFARGRVRDPSVNTVQALYEYLTGSSLLD